MYNKIFSLAHSNHLWPLFSKPTDPKNNNIAIQKTARGLSIMAIVLLIFLKTECNLSTILVLIDNRGALESNKYLIRAIFPFFLRQKILKHNRLLLLPLPYKMTKVSGFLNSLSLLSNLTCILVKSSLLYQFV